MELRNCPECGRVFAYIDINLCPACKKKDEENLVKVKEYLSENPHIGILELAEAVDVEEDRIMRWIREGRIEGKKFPGMKVSCERCGRPIQEGRFCIKCSNELAKGFSSLTEKEKEENISHKAKFHIRE